MGHCMILLDLKLHIPPFPSDHKKTQSIHLGFPGDNVNNGKGDTCITYYASNDFIKEIPRDDFVDCHL